MKQILWFRRDLRISDNAILGHDYEASSNQSKKFDKDGLFIKSVLTQLSYENA